jgi:hypothetical protein
MGGNVFKDKTDSIKLEHIAPTLEAYFLELKHIFPLKAHIFNLDHFKTLGSVGKKEISGDIDLGIGASSLLDASMSDEAIEQWGLDASSVHSEFLKLEKRSRTASPEMLRMKAFLKELTLYINKHAPTLYCDEKKVTNGNIFGLFPQIDQDGNHVGSGVQIDWMIGDIDWLMFSYHSDAYPVDSNVKGLHATQALLALFQVVDMSFNHINGVKSKVTGEVVASNPTQALEVLSLALGVEVTVLDRNNFYRLFEIVKQLPKERYDLWVDTYLKILDSTRADVPDTLQPEWLARKDVLGLHGNFLPETSALKVAR